VQSSAASDVENADHALSAQGLTRRRRSCGLTLIGLLALAIQYKRSSRAVLTMGNAHL
jgi:hypothetical protein